MMVRTSKFVKVPASLTRCHIYFSSNLDAYIGNQFGYDSSRYAGELWLPVIGMLSITNTGTIHIIYIYIDILYRYVMICKDIDLIDQWLFGYGTQFRRDGSFWTEARMAYFRFIPRSAVSQRSCARDLASLVVNWDSMHARVQKSGQITV